MSFHNTKTLTSRGIDFSGGKMNLYYLNDLLSAAKKNLELLQNNPEVFGRYAASYAQKGVKMSEQMENLIATLPPSEKVSMAQMVGSYRKQFQEIIRTVRAEGVEISSDVEFIT